MKGVYPFADMVLLNAVVYTVDAARPWAEAVAVKDGKIMSVGSSEEVRRCIGPRTEVMELGGGLILPGFRDAHIHPILGGMNLLECNLVGCSDLDGYLSRVAAYAHANRDQDFIRGGGWLPDAVLHRSLLDAVVPDRPAFLKSIDGHSAWVNGKALELSRITASSVDPPGGIIEKNPVTGEPTGILREWSAMEIVESYLPAPTLQTRVTAGWAFLQQASKMGIVSVHEAMGKEEELLAYQALERDGELTLRAQVALLCEPEKGIEQIERLLHLRESFRSDLMTPRAAKIFVDGVVEGHTARLLSPYTDMPGYCGEALWTPEELNRVTACLDAKGFQVHFHAVGDGAVRMALDAVEHTHARNGRRDVRPMIAHADLIHTDDIPRFGALGVIANLQSLWFCEEDHFARTTLACLGEQRSWNLYPIRDILRNGAALACGTDWPFSGELNTFNPLESIQVGVTRRGISPKSSQAYNPDQCVDLATIVHAHTMGGAYADFQENFTGSVTEGKSADLAVLDRNIFALPPDEISHSRVILTLFRGKPVHRAV